MTQFNHFYIFIVFSKFTLLLQIFTKSNFQNRRFIFIMTATGGLCKINLGVTISTTSFYSVKSTKYLKNIVYKD